MNCLLIYVPWQKAANFDHVHPDPCKIHLNVNGNTPGKITVEKKKKNQTSISCLSPLVAVTFGETQRTPNDKSESGEGRLLTS